MNALKAVRRSVQVLAGLGLCLMFGYPLLQVWFQAHPESAEVVERAAAQVDPEAGTVTKASQFVGNLGKSRSDVAEDTRSKATEKADEEAERKRDELRRFNANSDSYSDY